MAKPYFPAKLFAPTGVYLSLGHMGSKGDMLKVLHASYHERGTAVRVGEPPAIQDIAYSQSAPTAEHLSLGYRVSKGTVLEVLHASDHERRAAVIRVGELSAIQVTVRAPLGVRLRAHISIMKGWRGRGSFKNLFHFVNQLSKEAVVQCNA